MIPPHMSIRGAMGRRQRAFTMMEMVAVMAVIAILATLAVPSYLERIVRDQIKSALPLADIAKTEAILLVGSNVAETMPPVMQYFQEQCKTGGSLIVVDPRANHGRLSKIKRRSLNRFDLSGRNEPRIHRDEL